LDALRILAEKLIENEIAEKIFDKIKKIFNFKNVENFKDFEI
jgi:hypothetical protein